MQADLPLIASDPGCPFSLNLVRGRSAHHALTCEETRLDETGPLAVSRNLVCATAIGVVQPDRSEAVTSDFSFILSLSAGSA
jgi:hypothetical protein